MPSVYRDPRSGASIDLECDGCDLVNWESHHEKFKFAKHPGGFPIFLSPDRLYTTDEYRDGDPYSLEDNIASEFHQRRLSVTIELAKQALKDVVDTPRILDLGCGQGHITERLRCEIPRADVYGLDYSISAIEYAQKHFPSISFSVGDAYSSPYAPEQFHLIVCNNLWEHVPDPLVLLRNIRSLLVPSGCIVLSTPSRYRLGNLIRVLTGREVVFMSSSHVTEYSVGQIKEQLRYGGFEVVRVESRPIADAGLKARVAKVLALAVLRFLRSHHQLESTVFYFARARM